MYTYIQIVTHTHIREGHMHVFSTEVRIHCSNITHTVMNSLILPAYKASSLMMRAVLSLFILSSSKITLPFTPFLVLFFLFNFLFQSQIVSRMFLRIDSFTDKLKKKINVLWKGLNTFEDYSRQENS